MTTPASEPAPRGRSTIDLLRFWFTFETTVSRSAYLRHGAGLVALKYGVDVALVWLGTGTLWTPTDYLHSAPLLPSTRLAMGAAWLPSALAVWTLPFLWIGVSMTIRRLLDAGRSAWWSLLYFVPAANYALIALLLFAPTSPEMPEPVGSDAQRDKLPSALLSMSAGAGAGLVLLWIGVVRMESYGLAVFMGTPFVMGLLTGYLLRRRYPATVRETLEVVGMTVAVATGAAFAIGFEGAVCLLMVAPLGFVVAFMGGVAGRHIASVGERPWGGAALVLILFPGAATVESGSHAAGLREVSSAVIIDASPESVWDEVVDFAPIPRPTSLLFRLGVAYPTHAEIVGTGVDAVRYCHFSTGAFVEPITVWDPGRRLAFDVVESPRPLTELTPWEVEPPHLEGYLVPTAGEFRLVSLPDGRTRLEGSTWYEQRLRPEGYWILFSDYVIGRIHDRVLQHIRAQVERAVVAGATE